MLCFEVYRYDCVSRHKVFGEVIVPFKDLGSSGSGNVIKEISMSMNIIESDTMSLPPLSYLNGFSSNHDIIGDMKIEEQKNDVKDHDAW